ncbi:MAG: hypothetical protein JWM21_626 [Acidobacteria bacterium]|nr:hypothetical protein [Acidobacteriota bacterium]
MGDLEYPAKPQNSQRNLDGSRHSLANIVEMAGSRDVGIHSKKVAR